MLIRFEHRGQPMISREAFVRRMLRHGGIAFGIVGLSLVIGTAGFHYLAGQASIDAFLNSAMLLGGMGPVGEIQSTGPGRDQAPVVRIPPTGIPLEDIERHALIEALKMSNWVQKDAAELLAISPRVMNYKIKTLRIEFPRGRRAAPLAAVI